MFDDHPSCGWRAAFGTTFLPTAGFLGAISIDGGGDPCWHRTQDNLPFLPAFAKCSDGMFRRRQSTNWYLPGLLRRSAPSTASFWTTFLNFWERVLIFLDYVSEFFRTTFLIFPERVLTFLDYISEFSGKSHKFLRKSFDFSGLHF